MADLRRLLASLGYGNVRTLLNSGNAVFEHGGMPADECATRIEAAVARELGVTARVTVLDGADLATVVQENTLVAQASDHARLLAFVLADPLRQRASLAPLLAQAWQDEAVVLGQRAAYLWCPGGVLESRAGQALGKLLGDGVTARNWNTIAKLHALANAPVAPST